jgi:hypothetical protein
MPTSCSPRSKPRRTAREAWFDAQPELDPERLIFIDGEA